MAYTKTNWTTSTPINPTNLNHIEDGIADLYNAIFPVGQIVIKGDNEDYSNWLGFTWERTAVGKVLVGIDSTDTDFNTIGKTGGEKTHTLTIDEMPSHNHSIEMTSGGVAYQVERVPFGNQSVWGNSTFPIKPTGGGKSHNNMPPYLAVYIWKKVADT